MDGQRNADVDAVPEDLWKFVFLTPLQNNSSLARLVLAAMERVKGTEDGHRTVMGGVIGVYWGFSPHISPICILG